MRAERAMATRVSLGITKTSAVPRAIPHAWAIPVKNERTARSMVAALRGTMLATPEVPLEVTISKPSDVCRRSMSCSNASRER
ncbi:MAG: hypothetical protein BWY79_00678 [Actinobacteria bacterium ADurb.Bin444]|nr:MAG: hypothetical protein BWY79_00678 [Actinobacteria bacterium ADurb.Bin444]